MVDIDRKLCDECATCVGVCPADALFMAPALEADAQRCTSCGRCVKVCPFGALSLGGRGEGARPSAPQSERGAA